MVKSHHLNLGLKNDRIHIGDKMVLMQFADVETAEETTKKLYPSARRVEVINHGYDNIVVLVDTEYALRFPRNAQAFGRSQYEKQVLTRLPDFGNIEVPRLLREGDSPPHLITSFVHGERLSVADIRNLSDKEQKDVAKQIAKFAYTFHSHMETGAFLELRSIHHVDDMEKKAEEEWGVYFAKTLKDATFPTPVQDQIAKDFFKRWEHLPGAPKVVIHDDLHTDNMLFHDRKLIGVLDFADTTVGTPEQEFRQLYRINEMVLTYALDSYCQLSGLQLDVESSKTWAIAQELAAYSDRLLKDDTTHEAYTRSTTNLQKWLPEGQWRESN